jgi:hypothetical protein
METTNRNAAVLAGSSHISASRSGIRRGIQALLIAGLFAMGSGSILANAASASTATALVRVTPSAHAAALNTLVFNRINAIRTSFGLAAGHTTSAYNGEVLQAVMSNEDPPFAPVSGGVVAENSLWGILPSSSVATEPSPLVAVNGWVYHDGWNGSTLATWNADCTSAHAPGCNGHRRNVLSTPPVPGARLYVDVTTRSVRFNGSPALAVAALFVWKTPVASA